MKINLFPHTRLNAAESEANAGLSNLFAIIVKDCINGSGGTFLATTCLLISQTFDEPGVGSQDFVFPIKVYVTISEKEIAYFN